MEKEIRKNFDKKCWGKHAWVFLHYITFGYPDNPTASIMVHTYRFLQSLRFLIPCEFCRENYAKHISAGSQKLTLNVLRSKEAFMIWMFDLHNLVNKLTDAPVYERSKLWDVYDCRF